jgi:short-subunit dehydrogenase
MENTIKERVIILGASRGLGRELSHHLLHLGHDLFLLSRRIESLAQVFKDQQKLKNLDFTKFENLPLLITLILEFNPTRIVYCAGGGPYGKFASKEWKDHEWALSLNLIFPMRLIHELMRNKNLSLKQVVVVGSSIAENKPDPGAASYATSKHGLVGLISTLKSEGTPFDLRLFSPGYMDTEMLPPNSEPRRKGTLISDPKQVAQELWNSLLV